MEHPAANKTHQASDVKDHPTSSQNGPRDLCWSPVDQDGEIVALLDRLML